MIKKLIQTALMLIMVPAFAFAGSYSISVIGSTASGSRSTGDTM